MLEVMGCEEAISIWPHDNRGKYVHLSMVYVHTCYIFLKIWTWWIPTWRSGACRVYGFKLHVFGSLPVQQLLPLCLFWWVAGSPLFCVCCRNWFLIVCKFFVLVSFFLSVFLSFFLSFLLLVTFFHVFFFVCCCCCLLLVFSCCCQQQYHVRNSQHAWILLALCGHIRRLLRIVLKTWGASGPTDRPGHWQLDWAHFMCESVFMRGGDVFFKKNYHKIGRKLLSSKEN